MNNKESIKAWWTAEGFSVETPEEMAGEIQTILLNRYGVSIEEAMRQYIHWIAEKPDEFMKWIKEIRKDEKAGEYTKNLED